MLQNVVLTTALCLTEADSAALLSGRSITALSNGFINSSRYFAICSAGTTSTIKAWAELDTCLMYRQPEILESLSWNTIWKQEFLQSLLEERQQIFVNILRVHQLQDQIELAELTVTDKIGGFIRLSKSKSVVYNQPVLNNSTFSERKKRLKNQSPPKYPELEELQSAITYHAQANPNVKALDHTLRVFIGWEDPQNMTLTPDWIREITTAGNSSDGDLFEKRVRQGFIHLGFTNTLNNVKASLDPDATGGAGGIDIYCEKPYPIVGECKASKHESVPNSVSAQLIHLGNTHLGKEQFETSIKIIFAAGKLTDHAEKAAIENQINIMRPETLKRLVELNMTHPGSIDLLKLKPCLENEPFGTDADNKINEFIDKAEQAIKLRSYIVKSVKALREHGDTLVSTSTVRTHFNTAFAKELNTQLKTTEQAHGLLVELSSPLTGYLGRNQCDESWKGDRFYYLRDLILPTT